MNIIIFNGDGLKSPGFHTWRTQTVEIEITKALEETGNNVSFINFYSITQFYRDLRKIICDESIVLSLSEYVDDNNDIFVSDILEELRIPFVGSGFEAVRNALYKEKAKAFFVKEGIITPKFFVVSSDENMNPGFLGYPVVLKPRSSGCSEGVSIAHNQDQFETRVRDILAEFKQPVIVEEYIGGSNCREYTVGVLGNDGSRVAIAAEIIFPETNSMKLLDEEIKNDPEKDKIGKVDDSSVRERLRNIALRTMETINGKDVGRVDIRYNGSDYYVLEINLFPGLGNDSYLRRMLSFIDIGLDRLINMIVCSAVLRHNMQPTRKMETVSRYTQREIQTREDEA